MSKKVKFTKLNLEDKKVEEAEQESVDSGDDNAQSVRSPLSIGIELSTAPDIQQALDHARADHFEFVVAPLVHPRYERFVVFHYLNKFF